MASRKGKRKFEEDPSTSTMERDQQQGSSRDPAQVQQLDFYNAIFETEQVSQEQTAEDSSGDYKKILILLREQLGTSHKTEASQTRKLIKMDKFNKYTQARLKKLVRFWNRLDEDANIFKNRVDNGSYNNLLMNHILTPNAVLVLDTSDPDTIDVKLCKMVKNSGELMSHTLDGIQTRLQQSGAVVKDIKSGLSGGGSSVQFLETIIQEECTRMKEEMATFRRFREKFKSVESEYDLMKIRESASGDLRKTSLRQLKETMDELECGISKLRLNSASLDTRANQVQETFEKYEHFLDSQKKLSNINSNSSSNMTSAQDLDLLHHLAEIEKINSYEEKALGLLRKLQFDTNNRSQHDVLESVPYKRLLKSVTLLEDSLKKDFQELENLLSQFNVSCSQIISHSYVAEKVELDKQAKTRLEILIAGERIEMIKDYLGAKRFELSLHKAKEAHFQPLNKEISNFTQTLESRGRVLEAERDYLKASYEEGLIEQRKLLTVDQEMMKRIHDLEKSLLSFSLVPDASLLLNADDDQPTVVAVLNQNGSASSLETSDEVMMLKSQLMKAKAERRELQFQLDAFTKKIIPNPTKPSAGESLKSVRLEIERVKGSIKKLKKIKSLTATATSLGRELEKKKCRVETLLGITEPFGEVFDALHDQNHRLNVLVNKLPDHQLPPLLQFLPSTNNINNNNTSTNNAICNQLSTLENSVSNTQRSGWQKDERQGHDDLVTRIDGHSALLQKLHLETVHGILTRVNMLEADAVQNVQIACRQSQLDKVNTTLQEKTDALHAEKEHQAGLITQINQMKLKIQLLEAQKSSNHVDEVAMEEIRQYKELLMCSLCQVNYKNAILAKCQHVFCNVCLSKVKNCPECYHPLKQKDVCKLYLV